MAPIDGVTDAEVAREHARLIELASYRILDTGPEAAFDSLAHAASLVAGVPVAAVGLIDEARQWFKASVGLDLEEVARESAFCDYVVRERMPIVVDDVRTDDRFAASPMVAVEDGLRFYAGFPLTTPTGAVLGTLCVNDVHPHTLTPEQVQVLWTLADQAMAQLELRRHAAHAYAARDEARRHAALLDVVLDSVDVGIIIAAADGTLLAENAYGREILGLSGTDGAGPQRTDRTATVQVTTTDGRLLKHSERPLARTLREGSVSGLEVIAHLRDDEPRVLRAEGRALLGRDGELLGAMVAYHDITAVREREAELSDRMRDVERLAAASRKILSGEDAGQVACEVVLELCAAQQVSMLVPDGTGNLVVQATTEPALRDVRVPLDGESIVGECYRTQATLRLDPSADGRLYDTAVKIIELNHGPMRGAVYVPLLHEDECCGVLVFTTATPVDRLPDRVFGLLDILTAELSTTLERDRLRYELAVQATTDPLTALANRRTWDQRIALELSVAEPAEPVCLAVLDLDNFKAFNDTRGHHAGDDLLRAVSAAWTGRVRTGDLLARLGGEEFGLLLTGCSLADAVPVLDALRTLVPEAQTASIGVAQRRAGESAVRWYARADRALYRAKAAGRDRVCAGGEAAGERRRAAPAPDTPDAPAAPVVPASRTAGSMVER